MTGDVRLDISEVLGRAWDIFAEHWKPLVTISAPIYIGVAVLSAVLTGLLTGGNFLAAALVGFAGFGVVMLGSFVLQGMVVLAVDDIGSTGTPRSAGDLFAGVRERLGPLLTTALLAVIVIIIGFMLLVVPGVIAAVFLMFTALVVMLEDLDGTDALKRSREVVQGNGWVLFGLVVIVGIAAAIVDSIIGRILGGVLGGGVEARAFYDSLGGIATGPFQALVPIVAYFTLTRRGGIADTSTPTSAQPETRVAEPAPHPTAPHAAAPPAEVVAPVVTHAPTADVPVVTPDPTPGPAQPALTDDLPSAPAAAEPTPAEPASAADPAPPAEDPDAPA